MFGGNYLGGRYYGGNSFATYDSFGVFSINADGGSGIAVSGATGTARVTGITLTGVGNIEDTEYDRVYVVPIINLDQ